MFSNKLSKWQVFSCCSYGLHTSALLDVGGSEAWLGSSDWTTGSSTSAPRRSPSFSSLLCFFFFFSSLLFWKEISKYKIGWETTSTSPHLWTAVDFPDLNLPSFPCLYPSSFFPPSFLCHASSLAAVWRCRLHLCPLQGSLQLLLHDET